jgi:hypothetical protein
MRKERFVTITTDGRDKGKIFFIKEMSAVQAEKWAIRAFLALAHSGVDIPDEISRAGIAGIAIAGLKALTRLRFEDAEPLMEEMFDCVRIVRDPKHKDMTFDLLEDDIEEVATRMQLRMEVLELHTGFSLAELGSETSTSATTSPDSNTTRPTSLQ